MLDPDFGWHLRAGIDLLKRHLIVPRFDPYSYTMPDWRWVDHEWLSNAILAALHFLTGNLGLSILFGLLIAGIFLLAASLTKVEFSYKVLAALIALLAALPILGVRVQMITLLGLAFVLYIFYRYRRGEIKSLWWLPLVFLLWANLHGGFITGLGALGLVWLVELAKRIVLGFWPKFKKFINEATLSWPQLRHLCYIGLASGAATLINPYGWRLHYDIYLTLTDKFALTNISEWQPVSFHYAMSVNYAIYLILFAILLAFTYRKFEPTRWVVTLVFLFLSLKYWRNMPFFMLMSVGFLAEIIQTHTKLVFRQIANSKIFLIALTALVGILTAQRLADVVPKSFNIDFALRSGGYPIDAINWAKKNPDKIGKRMFNEYGWGGLLIWQFPEQKVWIDGRAPYWKNSDRFPFFDHQLIMTAQTPALPLLNKYGVDWVLVDAGSPLDWLLHGQKDWQKVYNDSIAVIYVRQTAVVAQKTR